jgi:hypothetical protein
MLSLNLHNTRSYGALHAPRGVKETHYYLTDRFSFNPFFPAVLGPKWSIWVEHTHGRPVNALHPNAPKKSQGKWLESESVSKVLMSFRHPPSIFLS